jgi:hypothetical protein
MQQQQQQEQQQQQQQQQQEDVSVPLAAPRHSLALVMSQALPATSGLTVPPVQCHSWCGLFTAAYCSPPALHLHQLPCNSQCSQHNSTAQHCVITITSMQASSQLEEGVTHGPES